MTRHRDYSEKTTEIIDSLMRKLVEEQYARAVTLLTEHRDELDKLAAALLEFEMLDKEDVLKVIKGFPLENHKKTRIAVKTKPEEGQKTTDVKTPDMTDGRDLLPAAEAAPDAASRDDAAKPA
jgi:hypothetical protein